ncbi:Hypp8445 [Branchiostoma lanceolatum]|uniref:Hypp8445 protein n=1 Tax=Branchiostoma lanceolatum TaxID=7740 RepID=A0A8K0EH99_BRALA|nr:Hypp8445 [Branchiostoma lanceolatum]
MRVDAPPSGEDSDEDTLRKPFATQPDDATKQQTSDGKISWQRHHFKRDVLVLVGMLAASCQMTLTLEVRLDNASPPGAALVRQAVKDVTIAISYGVLFAFIAVLTRQVADTGVTAFQLVFIQELSALLMALGLVLWSKTDLRPASLRVLGQLVLQGVGKYLVFVSLVAAITYLPPANAAAISKSALPLFVGVGAYVILQQRPSLAACFGAVLSTAGIVLVAPPETEFSGVFRSRPLHCKNRSGGAAWYVTLRPSVAACLGAVLSTAGIVLVAFGSWKKIGTSRDNSAPIIGAAKAVPAVTQILLCQLEVAVTFVLQFAFLGIVPSLVEGVGAAVITAGSLVDSTGIVVADSRERRLKFRKLLDFDIGRDMDKDSRNTK